MCKKITIENGVMLGFLPDCYKDKKICQKAVDNYVHASWHVPNCYNTEQMCNIFVGTHPSAIQFIPKCWKSEEMCY